MFARCCEQKIVVMSEGKSQLRSHLCGQDKAIIRSKNVFHIRCMSNLSLKNFSFSGKNWSPRKIVRSETITETIPTHHFIHWKNFFWEGGNKSVGGVVTKSEPLHRQ